MPDSQITDDIPELTANVVALTQTQRAVYESIRDHGTLHYFGHPLPADAHLKARLYPLLAGPTGSGKSFLIERVAQELQADYFRITYGDFIPMGARDLAAATLVRLGRKLARCHRLVVHIDELDKWLAGDREWGRSITTDLWNLLDGKIPWEQVMLVESDPNQKSIPEAPQNLDDLGSPPPNNFGRTGHLWIVGSGTWQAVFERQSARAIGFQSDVAAADIRAMAEAIRQSKVIPTELTARFATDILVLGYPTRAETEELLGLYGLKQLAADMNITLSADDVDYATAGMRALESLKTRLLLENLRRSRQDHRAEMMTAAGE